jgi:UDPglucose--hexose-1-phosphate uridylyltransferase
MEFKIMGQLRRDPITGRWIIISPEEEKDPCKFNVTNHVKKGGTCPFCEGHENMTPPEVFAFRDKDTQADTSGWRVRVIPNKFPALRIEGEMGKQGVGIYDMMNGIGAHEVIIETPQHFKEICDLETEHIELIIKAYHQRYIDLKKDTRFKYIIVFRNYGKDAGASLEHPHSQLIALPIVPKRVKEELKGAEQYFNYRGRCVFCDIIAQEFEEQKRIVSDNDDFLAFNPFTPRFPFETWIIPKQHCADFSHFVPTKGKNSIPELAKILKEILLKIKVSLGDPSYNFILHSTPLKEEEREDYHWHIEIMPRLTGVAGFEWGSGFYINPTPPEKAAECLKAAKI